MKKRWKMLLAGLLGAQMLVQPIAMAVPAEYAEEGSFAYMSDLQIKEYKVGYDDIGINQGVDWLKTMSLQVDGEVKSFTKGIGIHPSLDQDAYAIWDISSYGATHFTSYVGINYGSDQTGAHRGDACFEVWADDEKLWGDETFYKDDQDAAFIDVTIPEGTQTLKLVAKAGESMACDHALFAEPKLYVDATSPRVFTLTAGNAVLSVGSTTTMEPRVEDVFGFQDFTEEYTISYASQNPGVATVDETTGVVTAVAGGITQITAQAVPEDGGEGLSATAQIEVAETGWTLASPDGSISAGVILDGDGSLHFTVTQDGQVMVNHGRLGIRTSLGDFVTGMTLQGDPEFSEINEDYEMISGKASTYHNHANQMILTFAGENSQAQLQIVCRSYDDGFAYRYIILSDQEQEMTVNGEEGAFTLADNIPTYYMPASVQYEHEDFYLTKTAGSLNEDVLVPFMYQVGDNYVLVSEAALTGAYTGSILDVQNGEFTVGYPQEQGETVQTKAPFESPWRFFVVGSAQDLMENTMAENLSPAPDEDTYHFSEWVKPGVAAWSWLAGGDPVGRQHNPEEIKKYLDLAYEMGWSYFIMDEGWQPPNPAYNGGSNGESKYKGFYDWLPEIVAYAEERGIGLIGWLPCDDLNTPEKMAERIPVWAEAGIKGIKVDFFNRESQDRIQLLEEIYQECAKYHMVVNAHGANKPTGEVRTYPNVLAREAVRGEEFSDNRYQQLVTTPVVRAVGPADFTPRIAPSGDVTYAHQLAVPILFECGIPCMAGYVDQYRTLTGASFLKNLPAAWDETVALDTVPGQYITIARCSGDQWYLATNQGAGSREASVNLGFLGEGKYLAEIYTDAESGVDVDYTLRIVSKEDRIGASLKQGGACVVRLSKISAVNAIDIEQSDVVMKPGEYMQLTLKVDPENYRPADIVWSVDHDEIATVDQGKVYAKTDGVVCVTAKSALDGTVYDTCRIAVTAKAEIAQDWNIENPNDKLTIHDDNFNEITIQSEAGDFTTGGVLNNRLGMSMKNGDFSIEVKVNADLVSHCQTVALYVQGDNASLFSAQRRYHDFFGGNIFAAPWRENISDLNEPYVAANENDDEFVLRIDKKGDKLSAYYSITEGTWVPIAENVVVNAINSSQEVTVGVFACNGGGVQKGATATFQNFTVNGEIVPFTEKDARYVMWADAFETLEVAYGTPAEELNLPQQVQVLLSDGTKQTADVTWDTSAYQPKQSGAHTLTGTLGALEGVENTNQVTAQVTVVVGEKPDPADKTLLQKTYDYALKQDTSNLVPSAKEKFDEVMAKALAVLEDELATQEQVNATWNELVDVIHALGLVKGDKAMLELVIAQAEAMMGEADKYVETHWQQLVDALKDAKSVMDDANAMQGEVDEATSALLDAILAQRYKADKSILEDLIDKAEGINLDGYTAESVSVFRAALAEAQAVLADETLSEDDQKTVDAAVEKLTAAMDGLTAGGAPEPSDKPETTDKPEATDKPQATQKPGEGNVPQTGDHSQITLWVSLMGLCAAGALTLVAVKGRRKVK